MNFSHGAFAALSLIDCQPLLQHLPVLNQLKHLLLMQMIYAISQDHFRYKFANERLMRTARFYSSNWRTWAAVNIQLAWRRYTLRTRRASNHGIVNVDSDRRLRQYAAFFMSIRPHDHLE
ncbi:cyclic nucleotide-gated ion channel 2-like [Forsythia ovata]|uniref:Cyclic nucleotide-gated ion channel 2-like n=1 Tax=Forsythia ovata TaxID=205694 RepID=A0ABD1WRZ4_9LAMI